MNEEIVAQREYWNNEADAFQRIYTHRKSKLSNMLDSVFRKDMYDRYVFTIKHCGPIQDRTFLDVGCGNGLYSLELARKGARKVLGLDISEVMIGLCTEASIQERLDDRCLFEQTDLLAYEGATKFDVSFGIGLFDYISDPLPVLEKMRELTIDKAIIAFPRYWTWRAPVRKVRLTMRGCDVFFYTRSRIKRLLDDAGFKRHDIHK
ncbi:MAG TPA: class I SAM-dependent methyltransferase, partial [Pyrinomonadaceae bacterium]|nr:class I SAM-dependent methyltransferase [Pyrinomonadaceae bacterium]